MRFSLNPGDFLPQTTIVDVLLSSVGELLAIIPESQEKQNVVSALAPFSTSIVPSALGLDEVLACLRKEGLAEDSLIAADILLDAAYDLDLNYATDVINSHVEMYIETI